MNKKAIFVDIDGTIIDTSKGMYKPTEKTFYAFKELKKNHYVFLCTGRSEASFIPSIRDLEISGYIGCNGQYACVGSEEVYYKKIDEDLVIKIKKFIKDKNGTLLRLTPKKLYKKSFDESNFNDFLKVFSLDCKLYEEDDTNDAALLLSILKSKEEEKELRELFNDKLDIRKQPQFLSYDIGLKGESKGKAIEKILEYLNISKDDAYAFGDEINDIEMMKTVTHSVCMGSGNEEVKKIAEDVCESVFEDGLYNSLVRFGLIKLIE